MSRVGQRTLRINVRCMKCRRKFRRYANYYRPCPCGGAVNAASYEQGQRLAYVAWQGTSEPAREGVELEFSVESQRYERVPDVIELEHSPSRQYERVSGFGSHARKR